MSKYMYDNWPLANRILACGREVLRDYADPLTGEVNMTQLGEYIANELDLGAQLDDDNSDLWLAVFWLAIEDEEALA